MRVVILELASSQSISQLPLELEDTLLTKAIIAALQSPKAAVQARRSGSATCILLGDKFVTPAGYGLGAGTNYQCGYVAFSPKFRELVICYGPVNFTDDDNNPSGCILVGKVAEANLSELVAIGESIWKSGTRWAKVVNSLP